MLRSVRFHKFRFGVLGLALVFLLGLRAFPGSPGAHSASYKAEAKPAVTPPPAPPVTVDNVLPNLFYGAIPQGETPSQSNAPVLVFVHGLSGSYADWLESANCPPSPTPCGPNGPGAGTGNDMYDYAYAAGFRTDFVSLSVNNLSNTSNIQTNAAMLETMFPRILTTFGVTKVYFICHSKGGLDLQAALASTPPPPAAPWIGIANAVFTLGTPNQGDALASWLFLTPNGQAVLAAFPTLNNAGVQALEISNVEAFRSQWDPIFENAQIPFYTVAGDVCVATHQYPKGDTPACTNGGTGPILQSITGTAKPCDVPAGTPQGPGCPPPNDWLVTEPETILPASYSMALGVELENHYQLRLGDNSFGMIYARVTAQEAQQNGQPGLTRIATNGFGDAANTEAWSMAWFTNASGQSNLYVGTGRDVYCVTSADAAIESGLPGLYPPAVGDCNPDYHLLELQAEIWQYTPTTNTWLRVFQSPNSLTTTDNAGATVPTARDMGIRSLTVINEPGGVTALYAGTVTSAAVFETNHAVGGWPPPRILRSTDGVTWTPIPQDSGTFLGQLSAAGGGVACPTCPGASQAYQNIGVRSGGQLNGVTYFQVGNFSGVGRVIATTSNPSLGDNNYQYVSPPAGCDEPGQTPGVAPCLGQLLPVWILHSFNAFMYAATGEPYAASGPATAYGAWKTNGTGTCGTNACAPYTWAQVVQGGYAANEISNYALSFEIFSDTAPGGCSATSGTGGGAGGCLYVGTDQPSEMVRIHPDTTGKVPVANPDGSLDTMDSWDLVVGNPRTIPATATYGAGQSVLPISGIGQYFDNGFTGHFWRMGVGGLGLYMSTYDSAGEASYPYNGNGNAAAWSQEFGTDLFRTADGIHWTAVTKTGLGDGMNIGGRSFQATPFGLYWGTARPAVGGTQIFMIDNTQLDFNRDGVIDQKDVNLMTARLNTKAKPNDPMDMNQDGKITSADVTLLKTQCTYKNCAVPAVLPKQTTLTAPVLHSAPGALSSSGTTVSLDWPVVPNAVDYLVYQINMSPNGTQPPTLVGFPGPIEFVTRVTASGSTATYGPVPSPTPTLQLLYFVRAEDDLGNLSAPSNLVGGPSLAAQ